MAYAILTPGKNERGVILGYYTDVIRYYQQKDWVNNSLRSNTHRAVFVHFINHNHFIQMWYVMEYCKRVQKPILFYYFVKLWVQKSISPPKYEYL